MPSLTADIIGGLMTGSIVLLILAITIIIIIIVHNKKSIDSEKRFKHLFNQSFDSLIVFNEKGQIIDVNNSACNLLGYTKDKLLKFSIKKIIQDKEWHNLSIEIDKVFKSGLGYFSETILINNKISLIRVEAAITIFQVTGVSFLLGNFRDITKRKNAEDELRRKNEALKEILAHLEEEKVKIKKQVAQTIDKVLMPSLNKLLNGDGSTNKYYHVQLKKNLQVLANSTGGILHAYSKLSPREVEICNLIKNGETSKEIAKILNISIVTVNKHRERIRKKLVISNKHVNLASYLNNK